MKSPYDFSETAVRVEAPSSDYSQELQARYETSDSSLTITFNGTQTFGSDGRPRDADSD